MTVTRQRQAGFESRSLQPEMDVLVGLGNVNLVSSSMPKTGSYAATFAGQSSEAYTSWQNLASNQFRLGLHLNWNGAATGSPYLAQWLYDGAIIGGIRLGSARKLALWVGAGSVTGGSNQVLQGNATSAFMHIGLAVKLGASGWIELYKDGALEAQWSGNTACAGSTINEMRFAVQAGTNYFTSYVHMDDIFLDDTSGESSAVKVPDRRFLPISPCIAGASNQWAVTGAADNVSAIDDFLSGSHDGDTTYIASSALNEVAFFTLRSLAAGAIAASDSLVALIVGGVVKKTDAAASNSVNLAVLNSGSLSYGSDLALPSSWGWKTSRYETDPATGLAWAGSGAIATTQIGVRARGL